MPQMFSPQVPFRRNTEDGRIQQLIRMVQAAPTCQISDLARLFDLSPSRLAHLFKAETQLPLNLFLHEVRLQYAAHLLASTEERIKTIGFTLGYKHSSSFVRAFAARFREYPQTYRRRMRNLSKRTEVQQVGR